MPAGLCDRDVISVAVSAPAYVPDLSNNNGAADSIDFAAMKRGGMAAVILKATEGTTFVDPRFAVWASRANAEGLPVGAYHFGHPEEDVAAQVGLFERTIASAGVPIAFRMGDVETDPAGAEAFARAFCPAALVRLLYSGDWFAHADLSVPITGVEWLIAAYGSTQPSPPWGPLAGWQFTDGQHGNVINVPGVGRCDCSMFDPAALAALIQGGDVPQLTAVTGSFVPPAGHPDFGSGWDVLWSGAVATRFGSRFYGSYQSLPPQQGSRNFVAITARPDGKAGYVIHGDDGSFYTFGPVGGVVNALAGEPTTLMCDAVNKDGERFTFSVPFAA